jgi:hypothetical protein
MRPNVSGWFGECATTALEIGTPLTRPNTGSKCIPICFSLLGSKSSGLLRHLDPKLPYRSTHFRIGMMDMTGANKRSDDETGVLWPELLQPALPPRRHLRTVGPVPLPRKSAIHRAGEAWGPNLLVLARSFPGWDTARDRTRRCGPAGLHVSPGVYQQGWQQVAKTEFAKREATTRGSSQV